MAEVMDKTAQETEQKAAPAAKKTAVPAGVKKKKIKKTIRTVVVLAVVAGLGFGAWKLLGGKSSGQDKEIITETACYGSITAVVEGSGLTKAKDSETLTLTTAGTVLDVFVTEGQVVEAGEPLFNIDSPNAESAVQKARNNVQGYEKQLSAAYKDIAGLNLTVPYTGKIIDVVKYEPGDEIGRGKVATLIDDTQMRLKQYYSYAYADEITAGQKVSVSLPKLMSTVDGTVEAVHMVSRITEEGAKLFCADIVIPNAGVLSKDMEATAVIHLNGEEVYPYEPGKLEYYRTSDLNSTVSGTVISCNMLDWMSVTAGQVLIRIDGEDSEAEIFTIEQSLEAARKELETAEKNLANCHAVAPIAGKVIGLAVTQGQELDANTALVTISDTSTIIINATVDERNVGMVHAGMPIDLDQWGNQTMGMVESISLSSTISNGVATYPMVISADNTEGTIQVNSYINYSLTASQNENCLILPIQTVRTVGDVNGAAVTAVYVKADSRPDNAVEVMEPDEMIPEGFYPVAVEIGIQDNYNVEIVSGIEEGTEVFSQMMSTEAWG